jgi:hypothetical protein
MSEGKMVRVELCAGYAVLHLTDTSAKPVEVIVSTYQGAQELLDAAEVIRDAMLVDVDHSAQNMPFRFECWTEDDYTKRVQRGM